MKSIPDSNSFWSQNLDRQNTQIPSNLMGFIFDEYNHKFIEILAHSNMESIILEAIENIDFITSNIGWRSLIL